MKVTVSGKGVDIGESFRTYAQERLTAGVEKYLDRVNAIDVVVSKQGHEFHISINGNTGTSSGVIIKSRAQDSDIYAAFNAAVDKIETQLRRYKRRLTDHHRQRRTNDVAAEMQAVKYVIAADDKEEVEAENPAVIAEKNTPINTLTVSEAVMRMDLADLPALMFRNAANGRLNVVYKRADGNISWVDPKEEESGEAAA